MKRHRLLVDAAALVRVVGATEAARRLGVSRSTLHRWKQLQEPQTPKAESVADLPTLDWKPSKWATSVIESHSFDGTELLMVRMADEARAMALDKALSPNERARQQSEFSRIVRGLGLLTGNLVPRDQAPRPAVKAPATVSQFPDPRLVLNEKGTK